MTHRAISRTAGAVMMALGHFPAATDRRTLGVEDAIAMVRIQPGASADSSIAALSPDGTKAAAVVWRGDLERNVNVYSLIVLDIAEASQTGKTPLQSHVSIDFTGDPEEQFASPIAAVSFSADGQRVAFIGRTGDEPAQVYQAHLSSGSVTRVTASPDPVRSYIISSNGRLRLFSVAKKYPEDASRLRQLEEDGAFIFGAGALFPQWRRFITAPQAVLASRQREIRQYFWVSDGPRSKPRLIFDSRQSRTFEPSDPKVVSAPRAKLDEESTLRSLATLTPDPTGRYVLMYPYAVGTDVVRPEGYDAFKSVSAYAQSLAKPYGLIDLETGAIQRLIDAPHQPWGPGTSVPVWAPDGQSVIIYSLLPLDSSDGHRHQGPPARQAAQWIEVELSTRRVTPLGLEADWRVLGWKARNDTLIVWDDVRVATLSKHSDGQWGGVTNVRRLPNANTVAPSLYRSATDGRQLVTIEQSFDEPPEIAVFDLSSRTIAARTNLNPQLRNRPHANVEEISWVGDRGLKSSGFLLKPLGYVTGRRYPLVILLDDNVLGPVRSPYLLDGTAQLSGHALQMLAADGFMVLYTRRPPVRVGTLDEGKGLCEHVESAIAHLERLGMIDVERVGLSGWSRAGYYTDYILIHSSARFAAATRIDGGGREYNDGMRPLRDDELNRIRTPVLVQLHGPASLAGHAPTVDRLDALGKPIELLYFAGAPHSTVRPRHRYRSLTAHIDWWKFWLQDREDPSPEKEGQYSRWRALRDRSTSH